MSTWRPRGTRWWLDLTPLIDVVFTLLLFIILAAQFQDDPALPLALPQDTLRIPGPTDPVVVTVAVSGEVALEEWVVEADAVGSAAAAMLQDRPGAQVVLRADGAVPYDRVFAVIASLGRAGIHDLGLSYEARP